MNNFSKTLIVAFLFSIAIHFIMFFTIERNLKNTTLNINTTNNKNTAIKKGLVKIKYVKIKKVEKTKRKPIINRAIEKSQIKKRQKKINTKTIIKKSIPIITLPSVQRSPIDLKKFFTIQKKEQQQRDIQEQKEQKRQKEIKRIEKLPEITQSYIKLYGEQYFEFSETQRRYLRQNLNKIGKITQRYLQYPSVSIRTKQKGINVVEFYLHPNGDITDLKLADTSNYTALDTNTIDTIKIAYQDYPRPLEKVKIKIYVKYILY